MDKYYEHKYIKYKNKYFNHLNIANNNLNGGDFFGSSLLNRIPFFKKNPKSYFDNSYDLSKKNDIIKLFSSFNKCTNNLNNLFKEYTLEINKLLNNLSYKKTDKEIININSQTNTFVDGSFSIINLQNIYEKFSNIIIYIDDIDKNSDKFLKKENFSNITLISDDSIFIILKLISSMNKIFNNYLDNWQNKIFSDKYINIFKNTNKDSKLKILECNNIQLGYLFYSIINKLREFLNQINTRNNTNINNMKELEYKNLENHKQLYDDLQTYQRNFTFNKHIYIINDNNKLIKDFVILFIFLIKLYNLNKNINHVSQETNPQLNSDYIKNYIKNNKKIFDEYINNSDMCSQFNTNNTNNIDYPMFNECYNNIYNYLFNDINLYNKTRYEVLLNEFILYYNSSKPQINPINIKTIMSPANIKDLNHPPFTDKEIFTQFLIKNNINWDNDIKTQDCNIDHDTSCNFGNISIKTIINIKNKLNPNIINDTFFTTSLSPPNDPSFPNEGTSSKVPHNTNLNLPFTNNTVSI